MSNSERYDISRTWRQNLEHSFPLQHPVERVVSVPGEWQWCGLPADSPLGIPAGPLLNGRWLLHYARLGFDILTYKTVRSAAHLCYELPNLVPVSTSDLCHPGATVPESSNMTDSWAVSFGMPSVAPDDWRRDISSIRHELPEGKLLVVSVVGTQPQKSGSPEEDLHRLAQDFAQTAAWAVESGAHGIEANFSCPNVATPDGQLYQLPEPAAFVAAQIRSVIGRVPLTLKIGRMVSRDDCQQLINAVGPYVDGIAMTNSIAARVQGSDGVLLFDGQPRGICGEAIRKASVDQVSIFSDVIRQSEWSLDIVGVGGISNADHVQQYLTAGAGSVGIATAAMLDPELGLRIRREWHQEPTRQ